MIVGMVVVLEFVNDNGGSGSVEMLLVMEMVDGEHIEPGESLNMPSCCAFELTQLTPQRVWSKDAAPEKMTAMLLTLDTSHLDKSWLKDVAPWNIPSMSVT